VRTQKLGIYLIIVGLLEAGALFWGGIPFLRAPFPIHGVLVMPVLYPIFPNLGWGLLSFAAVVSPCWPVVIGVPFVMGKRPLKTYVVCEVALSAPFVLLAIDLARFGSNRPFMREHGFLSLLLIYVLFSALPLLWAIWALKGTSSQKDT
jgi:hypothetical protein